ncbi:hypothetical protein QBC43DRAFT_358291 [Cladorrhinum sp. PSN259]|nr:hypothetical protein QBC43DRAFT_358291 [Cladorrhinum sp. PSN259]
MWGSVRRKQEAGACFQGHGGWSMFLDQDRCDRKRGILLAVLHHHLALSATFLCTLPIPGIRHRFYYYRAPGLFALSFLFYHASWGRYESLTQSDIENGESTRYDSDNESESDSNGCKADPLGIRIEVRKEIDELGGWWRFITKFRIFLKFMWPFDDRERQHRLAKEKAGYSATFGSFWAS